MAQCEFAYYLFIHVRDEDRRKGIQAQGVVQANVVGETYDRSFLTKLPIPPFVLAMLSAYKKIYAFGQKEVERDEEESGII